MAVGDVTGVVMDEEINNLAIVDSTAETPETAIEEIQTGKSIFKLFGSIKKALQGCLTTSKLANNLATTDKTMALAAPMGKQLGDSITTINASLNTQLNYGYKVRRGSPTVTIDSDGFGVINHNGGFTNSGTYDCICNVNGLILISHWNIDGNKTSIGVRNINSSNQIINYTGTIAVQWIAVGK